MIELLAEVFDGEVMSAAQETHGIELFFRLQVVANAAAIFNLLFLVMVFLRSSRSRWLMLSIILGMFDTWSLDVIGLPDGIDLRFHGYAR